MVRRYYVIFERSGLPCYFFSCSRFSWGPGKYGIRTNPLVFFIRVRFNSTFIRQCKYPPKDTRGRIAEMKIDKKRFDKIEVKLISWYKSNRRKFSWRKKIRDPYEVLVCEVMGQQTQASRIEEFLPRFLSKFPNANTLANAKKADIIKEWQGLGYNRRALNLQRAAIELSGRAFPRSEDELLDLPGVGDYT